MRGVATHVLSQKWDRQAVDSDAWLRSLSVLIER